MGEFTVLMSLLEKNPQSIPLIIAALVAFILQAVVALVKPKKCKVCKKYVSIAQMKMYRDNVAPVISRAIQGYEYDLRQHIEDNNLCISDDRVTRICVDVGIRIMHGFSLAESYMQSLVDYNHIPDPDDKDEYQSFLTYTKEKFDKHNTIVWDYQKSVYSSEFILDINPRRKKWESENDSMYREWVDMFKTFKKISKGTYKVGVE